MSSYEEKMYDPLDRLVKRQALTIHGLEKVIMDIKRLRNQGRSEEADRLINRTIDGFSLKMDANH